MERESFEDEEVAKILNSGFISIKVDREERPDIDHIYMNVCQMLTNHGGWPLTVIMTPDQKPFFAGTYFPKHDSIGMAGLITILEKVKNAWDNNRKALVDSGDKIVGLLNTDQETFAEGIGEDTIIEAFTHFEEAFDEKHGGFGSAPKFPTPHTLYFLLRYWYNTKDPIALSIVEKTLISMYKGGIYDHVGFGFSRYSTDRKWLVPHFEKMLYDNALLAIAYIEAYQATGNKKYGEIADEILAYVQRDMTSPSGAFYSAEDADSEGEEGKFYVWSEDEIIEVLGKEDGEKYCRYFDITQKGNFEGKNIPNLIRTDLYDIDKEFLDRSRERLYRHRERRVHPYKDDKVLTSWNGLMIAALSIAGRVLGKKQYDYAAKKAVDFILKNLIRNDGRLLARYRDGEASYHAYVDDYSFFIWGLIELYETSYDEYYLKNAIELSKDLVKYFWDSQNGGFFVYGSDSEQLITRPKEIYDGATPSGNSVTAYNFLKLARITGDNKYEERAVQILNAFGAEIKKYPSGYTFFLIAAMYAKSNPKEVVVVSETANNEARRMLNVINEQFRPFTVSVLYLKDNNKLTDIIPYLENYNQIEDKATAYVCENFACRAPVTDINSFREMISN
ncbi:hypothetical protein Bccel_2070 [Pseudobacteroides cellulosolvens ATCC 35603 = DSM 2933]|uniref:Spermatogenesis-associated protein 20-like TRX domain-containing protein n=1 Tax=Pseudobacteroides cellulosolvens ATCC 35603 = DSM 2933 TaxID=398512 RepID=A0A0L6JM35_9FIRM|nr:hypothetical protein Bccel_2070 [Pseudobacteroides cellulosolvens ATCC 35603 = DSM 2933]